MKAKDLTKIKSLDDLRNMNVGDLTWKPREGGSEFHRRGVVTEKYANSIEVIEHYYTPDFDSRIDKRFYFINPNSGELTSDTHTRVSSNFNKEGYDPLKEELIKAGVKFTRK